MVKAHKVHTYHYTKNEFSIKDLVTFTEKILNGKLYFLCKVSIVK